VDHTIELYKEIGDFQLITATISSPQDKQSETAPSKITIRPTSIKSQRIYQVTRYIGPKAIHANISPAECLDLVRKSIPGAFKQGVIETLSASYHLVVAKDGDLKIKRKTKNEPAQELPIVSHNKAKKYAFPEGTPVPFLVALGIMKPDGRVPREKFDKFRQINHFIELIDKSLDQLPKEKILQIVDFGSGKSYLTFALHYYLTHTKKRSAEIVGIDLKKDVVEACQDLANGLGESSLSFVVGDIKDYKPSTHVDMVITLHACNLATDAALVNAVAWGAEVILSVPCCQHELMKQVECSQLDTLLRHGILKERFSALVTDAMRAELLTAAGYDVDVIEFIDLEHTPKNLMIRAMKSPSGKRSEAALERYQALKDLLHITPWLESKLS
jgi:trans-aconitate methyltransferase